ncbi:hypothetical protein [Clostridium thermosuccinogenes]|jgi:hypothetical protein|uniref:hypothetical protein n=1 Tax=Clostridium thermosuccinogenes TaxID=84032 RepID=UPI000CCC60E1|nr:hypothetical protein [Pseudoclostridium thermosuccinogenes]PNT94025.1 hypothetical protein CDQ83_11250 [Pseudoclostridium thermosuccinogenes]
MSEDINNKLKQITDILGQDTLPDNIKGLLSLLASASNQAKDNTQAKAVEAPPPMPKEDKLETVEPDDNLDMVRKIRRAIDKLNTNTDPRINLLASIRPFMNEKRQKRVADCIKILQMASLVKLLEENDTGKPK